jgi:phosphoglycerate dehydrogenase-like enzyme
MLHALGLRVTVVRQQEQPAGEFATVAVARWHEVLPQADWLLLACPLTEQTQGLLDACKRWRSCRTRAHLVNVSRGEIVDEPALIAALQSGRLAGAFLDVFAQEPLPADSPLWHLPNVIATPHSAGLSDGNAAKRRGACSWTTCAAGAPASRC